MPTVNSFEISIPGLPPSTNKAFVNLPRGGRCLSHEASVWKQGVKLATLASRVPKIEGLVKVSLTFYSLKWFTKGKTVRRIDVANLEKLFVDSVFEQLGMEDSNIFHLTLRKLFGPELSVIRVTALDTPPE